MKIKTSEILIENISKEMFLKKWGTQKSASVNFLNKINLKVPFSFKGHKGHIRVYSTLDLKETDKGVAINLISDFKKHIIYSVLAGMLPSLIFLFLYSSLALFIISSVLISVIFMRMFYINTLKLSKNYLKEIKQRYS